MDEFTLTLPSNACIKTIPSNSIGKLIQPQVNFQMKPISEIENGVPIVNKIPQFNLYDRLKNTQYEKDVEYIYRSLFEIVFPDCVPIKSLFRNDGLLTSVINNLVLLMEYKYDLDFKDPDRKNVCETLTECLGYIKKFEQNGQTIPKVVFVGDKNECFCVGLISLEKYLLRTDVNWVNDPSGMASANPNLVKEMQEDDQIDSYIWDLSNQDFNFEDIINKILDLNRGIHRHTAIIEANIDRVFKEFCSYVVTDSRYKNKNENTEKKSNKLENIFIGCLTQPDRFYNLEKKRNTLVTPTGDVRISHRGYVEFFNHYRHNYSPIECQNLTSICDQIIEKIKREWQGGYFTPFEVVKETHTLLSDRLGKNWKNEYVVWDCSCGTLNLTRDYPNEFKELYCSTDLEEELQTGIKYNPEAIKFQFNFLNDSLDNLPVGLLKALEEGKKFVFFNNPPYVTSTNLKMDGTSKKKATDTMINKMMIEDKKDWGNANQDLYGQFLFRIMKIMEKYNLKSSIMATISSLKFFTGDSFKEFRNNMNMTFVDGIMFPSSWFSGVSGNWPVGFSLFEYDFNKNLKNINSFKFEIKDYDEDDQIVTIGEKQVYNLDNIVCASDWVKIKCRNTMVFPNLSCAINISDTDFRYNPNAIGYMYCGRPVELNTTQVGLLCAPFSFGGFPIFQTNFNRAVSLFAARTLIKPTWINAKDEYMTPTVLHSDYQQWNNDCIVYCLFNNQSKQSSLRKISFQGEMWLALYNHFFWMSLEEMKQLSIKYNFNELYNDTIGQEDRYVYNILKDINLSPDAKLILETSRDLIRKSFSIRQVAHQVHPEFHLNAWDAGWYQIRNGLLKDNFSEEYDRFVEMYEEFQNRLRPLVYELGFLRK